MSDNLILGMAIGIVVGGLIVHSSKKAQNLIEEGKDFVKEQIDNL